MPSNEPLEQLQEGHALSAVMVREALRGVVDPELGDNIVDLGMVDGIELLPGGAVAIGVALTTPSCPLRGKIEAEVTSRVGALAGVSSVQIRTSQMGAAQKAALMERARSTASQRAPKSTVPMRARVLAISSGKGGVGKSSVAVNLAAGLAARGFSVGLLDADIAGFSVPRMLGLSAQLEADPAPGEPGRNLIKPVVRKVGTGELAVVSMGFLAEEEDAILWRGLLLNRALQHFLEDVAWGDIDYLVADMPPGTGDVQMGLARMLPNAEVVVVTTPAQAAQKVAARVATMALKSHLRVVGVVENMSSFDCSHGERYELFGHGGGEQLAASIGAPLMARVPLEPAVCLGGDTGEPVALQPSSPAGRAFTGLVEAVVAACPPVQMASCSARLAAAFQSCSQSLEAAAPNAPTA